MAEDPIRRELDALKADIAQLRLDIKGLTEAIHEVASDKVKEARNDTEERLHESWEDLEQKLDEIIRQGRSTVDQMERQVGQHPAGSLLTAFGIGFLIAKILELGGRR